MPTAAKSSLMGPSRDTTAMTLRAASFHKSHGTLCGPARPASSPATTQYSGSDSRLCHRTRSSFHPTGSPTYRRTKPACPDSTSRPVAALASENSGSHPHPPSNRDRPASATMSVCR